MAIPTAAAVRAWCRSEKMAVELPTTVGLFLCDSRGLALLEVGFPRRTNEHELQMYLDEADPDTIVTVTHEPTGIPDDGTLAALAERIAAASLADAAPEPRPAALAASEDPDQQYSSHVPAAAPTP